MFAQIKKAILILAIGALAVDASAIKGHSSRPNEDAARSIKLASASNTIDKSSSPVAQAPPAPVQQAPKPISTVPILESSKKVYNDESIRRYSSVPVQQQPIQPVIEQAPAAVKSASVAEAAPVAPVPAPVAAPVPVPVSVPVPVQAPVAVPVQNPVVVQQQPPVVAVVPAPSAAAVPVEKVQQAPVQTVVVAVVQKEKEQAPVEPAKAAAPAVVEAKSAAAPEKQQSAAPVEKQPVKAVEQPQPVVAAAAPQDPLPPQSVRSAVVKEDKPAEEKVKEMAPIVVQSPPAAEEVPQSAVKVSESQPAPVAESTLEAKKSYVSSGSDSSAASGEQPLNIEVPAPDPGLVLSEPIDSTTKLLIDLDEHVQTFLPADQQHQPSAPKDQNLTAGVDYSPPSGKSSAPLVPYSSSANNDESIVPPMPSLDGVEKASANPPAAAGSPAAASPSGSPSTGASPSASRQGQVQNQQQVITQLLDQLDSLQNRIQDTINQLVARRRYVMSALLRPMGTYVRRVRTNLERLQNRVNQLQAAASSVGGPNNQNRPGGFVDAAAIETIRRRIDDISKRISDIVNRIRFSLTPTSAPMNNNGR